MNITDATGTCPRLETRETRGTPSDGRRGYTFRQKRATRQTPPVSNVFHWCPQVQNHLSSLRGDQAQSGQRSPLLICCWQAV